MNKLRPWSDATHPHKKGGRVCGSPVTKGSILISPFNNRGGSGAQYIPTANEDGCIAAV